MVKVSASAQGMAAYTPASPHTLGKAKSEITGSARLLRLASRAEYVAWCSPVKKEVNPIFRPLHKNDHL